MADPAGLIEPIRGACDIQIYSKRYWGQPYPWGWGLEHAFPRLSDRTPTGDPDEAREAFLGSWTHSGTEIIPEVRALAISPYTEWRDCWPVDCTNETEYSTAFGLTSRSQDTLMHFTQNVGTWMPTAPTGYTTSTDEQIWLTCTGLTTNYAQVTSLQNLPADAYLTISMYRWAPVTPFATQRPYVTFTYGNNSTFGGGLTVVLPLKGPSTDGAVQTPYVANAETSEVLAELDQVGIGAGSYSMFDRLEVLSIRPLEAGLMAVQTPGSDTAALIQDEDAVINEAPITVACYGAYVTFGLAVGRYILPGQATRSVSAQKSFYTVWPEYLNGYSATVTHDCRLRKYEPTDTSATGSLNAVNVPEVRTQPSVTLQTDDEWHTPLVYLVQEVHPPLWFDRSQSDLGDLSDFVDAMDIYETRDMRMARADIAVRSINETSGGSTDTLLSSVSGNEWVHCGPIYHQWPDYTLAQDQASGEDDMLAGWLDIGERVREGGIDEGEPNWNAVVLAWPYRFIDSQKTMAPHAGISWAGWNFKDAVERILPAHGVPTAAHSWDPINTLDSDFLDNATIPCERNWERRYTFEAEEPVLDALDTLAFSVGVRMRITRAGKWEWFIPQAWDGHTYEHTLDGDQTSTFVDVIERISHGADSRELRNVVYHEGADAYGQMITGLVQDYESLFDTTSDRFVGDVRMSVHHDAANPTPDLTAYLEYQRRLRNANRIQWTWAGHPSWKPGERVLIEVDDIGVPSGTVAEITEKTSRIRAGDGENRYQETVTAAVVGWG